MNKGFLNARDRIPGLDGHTIGDFWHWAYSDFLSNRNCSLFAEFIVAVALGLVDRPRVESDASDLRYRGFKVEVKPVPCCQDWREAKLSNTGFGMGRAITWSPIKPGSCEFEATRRSAVYVFYHYPDRDKARATVLDIRTWDFYVTSSVTLNQKFADSKSLSLALIKELALPCQFDWLEATVDQVLDELSAPALLENPSNGNGFRPSSNR